MLILNAHANTIAPHIKYTGYATNAISKKKINCFFFIFFFIFIPFNRCHLILFYRYLHNYMMVLFIILFFHGLNINHIITLMKKTQHNYKSIK